MDGIVTIHDATYVPVGNWSSCIVSPGNAPGLGAWTALMKLALPVVPGRHTFRQKSSMCDECAAFLLDETNQEV